MRLAHRSSKVREEKAKARSDDQEVVGEQWDHGRRRGVCSEITGPSYGIRPVRTSEPVRRRRAGINWTVMERRVRRGRRNLNSPLLRYRLSKRRPLALVLLPHRMCNRSTVKVEAYSRVRHRGRNWPSWSKKNVSFLRMSRWTMYNKRALD